jgi:hypothetical protein
MPVNLPRKRRNSWSSDLVDGFLCFTVSHGGVEQVFRPAVNLVNSPASAAEVPFIRAASDKTRSSCESMDIRNSFSYRRSLYKEPALSRRVCLVSICKRVSGFLALFRKLLFSLLGLKQYIVRIAHVLFPALSRFPVTAPVVKLKLVQVFQKFLVEFGLQFKSKTWEELCHFGFEQSGLLKGLKMLDDSSKGQVQAGQGFVNICLLSNINCSQGSPF